VALVALVAGLGAARSLLPDAGRTRSRARDRARRPSRPLLLLGAVAFGVFLVDGTATTWLAVHVRELGAGQGLAAGAYLGFTAALLAGRLAGDRLTARLGRRRLVRGGAGLVAAGLAAALAAPGVPWALAGWAVVGLALGPLAPAVLGAAPDTGRGSAPAALATVTTIGYLGSFAGPPAVGVLADGTGLTTALVLPVVVVLAAGLLAGRAVPPRRDLPR
jgi:MFS family permease